MRIATVFLTLSLLLKSISALPSMGRGLDPDALKRALENMKGDKKFLSEIREIADEQAAQLEAWKRSGKRSVADSLLDMAKGGNNNNFTDFVGAFPRSVEGLKRFPESEYPFQYPGPTDQRGPCPALNTLANHGYISRTGIVSAGEVVLACARVFNLAHDFCALLTYYSLVFDGNPVTQRFSIGGADPRTNSLGKLGGILGTETGLVGHSRVEGDASATRCDFYLCNGDNHNMQPELFAQMTKTSEANGNQFNIRTLQQHLWDRYRDSKSRNPNAYFMPVEFVATVVAYYFIFGCFSNGTVGDGSSANYESIASFYGASKENGSIVYIPERIPEQGWYRRSTPLTITEGLVGFVTLLSAHTYLLGANAGSTDRFIPGPDPPPTSVEGVNGLGCFLYNAIYANSFSQTFNIIKIGLNGLNLLLGVVDPNLRDFFGCTPNIPDQTDPNAYGGVPKYLNDTSVSPGSPQGYPCTNGNAGSGQCLANTNTYAN